MPRFPPERIETADFVIRAWTEHDGHALWEAIEASRDHLASIPSTPRYTGPDETTRLLRASRARYLLGEDFDVGVWSPDEALVLGRTGFHLQGKALEPAKQAEIGMWIRADRAGRGLGSAVLTEMLRWGFDDWEFMRLSWRCSTHNRASQRCAEKAGLLREGTLRGDYDEVTQGRRDTACYGLSLIDYQLHRAPRDQR